MTCFIVESSTEFSKEGTAKVRKINGYVSI